MSIDSMSAHNKWSILLKSCKLQILLNGYIWIEWTSCIATQQPKNSDFGAAVLR